MSIVYSIPTLSKVFRNITYSNRPDRVTQLAEQYWASIPKVTGSTTAAVRHIFKLARCGYTHKQQRNDFDQITQFNTKDKDKSVDYLFVYVKVQKSFSHP